MWEKRRYFKIPKINDYKTITKQLKQAAGFKKMKMWKRPNIVLETQP